MSNSNNDIKEPTATPTTEKIEIKEITLANVGDYIKLGSYPQTSSGQNQPIEWQVLAKENNKILVISRHGLDAKRFDGSSNKWANSEIRKWLNSDFYNEAFSKNEKKNINIFDGDQVFLLSRAETEKYFANNEVRKCKATDYAVKNGAYVKDQNGCGWWWLRSPSANYINCILRVQSSGSLDSSNTDLTRIVVRPALWINL